MKLSFWTIIIMAISVAFAILAFGYFQQFAPTQTAIANYNAYREQLEREANKRGAADRRVLDAQREVAKADNVWRGYVATRTPETDVSRGGISLAVNEYQLSVDTQKFRNSIQRAVNAQVKKGGVKVISPEVRGPADTDGTSGLLAEYYNYQTIGFPVVIFDLGTVTVTGTYDQIMANVRSYKTMPRYLAVTDGLVISGTSPHLTGTYNLSIVGFIRGKEVFPSVAAAGAAGAAGAVAPGRPGGGPPAGPVGRGPGAPGARGGSD